MYVVSAVVLRTVPWMVLVELRFAIGLVVLSGVAWRKGALRVERRDLPRLALLGLIGYTLSIGLQFAGTALSGAALGSLITAASPALIGLFAIWLLRERITLAGGIALALGLAGVVIVVGLPDRGAGGSVVGNVALGLAAITWAAYTVLSRVETRRYSSLTVTTWANVFGLLFSLPIATFQQATQPWLSRSTPELWLGVVYLGVVCTAVAFYLWNKGFEYLPAGSGGLYFLAQPLVGSTLGWALLGERLGPSFLAGAVLILAGVTLATVSTTPARVDTSPPSRLDIPGPWLRRS